MGDILYERSELVKQLRSLSAIVHKLQAENEDLQESLEKATERVDTFKKEQAANRKRRRKASARVGVSARGISSRSLCEDVTLPRLLSSPAFNDYYAEEWPPPRRHRSGRLQRQKIQRDAYGHVTVQQCQHQEVYFDYFGSASVVGLDLHQEQRLAFMLPPTTAVTNLSRPVASQCAARQGRRSWHLGRAVGATR
ncbi:hypothetical protein HPB51_016996 [Rhipicephalus microplus]|uniref:Uncharacterized protein n=1 Tax=Rhipicephalus microplus TaxID=6941 RepID=A0A9J6F4Y6_RHIMP|nr:hypothetical protein HPB51_016996 [Rhipicephalus microplus]